MRTVTFGRRCNQRCPFCDAKASADAPARPTAEVRAEVDAAIASGGVRFSGGEPLLERGILQAISYARARGVPVEVSTHGRMLADPALVGRLVAAGATAVAISLHGHDAATHAAHIGGDLAAFDQACAAIEGLHGQVERTVRTVVTRRNAPHLAALASRIVAWGVRWELRALTPVEPLDTAARALLLPLAEAWVAADDARAAALAAGSPDASITLHGFELPGDGAAVRHAPRTATAERLRRAVGGPDAELAAGLKRSDAVDALASARRTSVQEVGLSLAAARVPIVDLGVTEGGLADDARPLPALDGLRGARRVAVLVRPETPLDWAVAALPATVTALAAYGVEATLLSPWALGDATDPRRPAPRRAFGARDPRPHPTEGRASDPAVQTAWRQAVANLTHGGFDAALVDGPEGYATALGAGIARVVVLERSDAPIVQPLRPTDLLCSATPEAHVRYRALGIPLAQIAFLAPLFDLRLRPTPPRIASVVRVDAEARMPARAGAIHLCAGVPIELAAAWTTSDVPLLAEDVPALRHLLRDGVDGTLLRPGQPARLEDARPAQSPRVTTPEALAAWLAGVGPRRRVVSAFGDVGPWTSW
jgi:pyruvate-formate lyase-activating enzyme